MYLCQKYGEYWHIPPNISDCTEPVFTKFSDLVDICMGMINMTFVLQSPKRHDILEMTSKSVQGFWGFGLPHVSQLKEYLTDLQKQLTHTHTHTYIHTQPFYCSSGLCHNPVEAVPEETFTHSHLSWLSVIPTRNCSTWNK